MLCGDERLLSKAVGYRRVRLCQMEGSNNEEPACCSLNCRFFAVLRFEYGERRSLFEGGLPMRQGERGGCPNSFLLSRRAKCRESSRAPLALLDVAAERAFSK